MPFDVNAILNLSNNYYCMTALTGVPRLKQSRLKIAVIENRTWLQTRVFLFK